jgi:hypothetical protein
MAFTTQTPAARGTPIATAMVSRRWLSQLEASFLSAPPVNLKNRYHHGKEDRAAYALISLAVTLLGETKNPTVPATVMSQDQAAN